MKPNVIFTAIIKFKSVQVSATLQQNGVNTLVDRWLQRCRYLHTFKLYSSEKITSISSKSIPK